ncbi:MAG: hypothetical protein KAJ51_13710, partial [Thermoplasmata archaeon]|nr:hypothetical protein [Thermoplasmata archaeon]
MKTIVNKETNNWYYLKKKPTGGYFYSVAGLIVISLGLVLLVLGLLVIIDGDLDGLLLILPVVALFIIAYQLMKYGIFHSIPGWVRFNNEKVQLLARKNVTIEIEFDRNTRILPQFNHFLGGYNKYWGFVIIRNKKRIEVTPNLGFSIV